MTSKKQARRALISSFTALLLCFAMLVGTTFAWFTDVAETGLNQIIAGNLDVELVDETGKKIEGATDLFDEPELWEPGAVAYQQLQVKNVGSLDLKYSMSINYENVNSLNGHALSEVLKYAIIDASAIDLTDREAVLAAAKASTNKGALNDYAFTGTLYAEQNADDATNKFFESALQTLVVFWEPNADDVDNRYNANNGQKTSNGEPLQINLGVRVYATQVGGESNEKDSFGDDYDLNAPTQVIVKGVDEVYTSMAEAIAENPTAADFTVSGPIDMDGFKAVFNADGKNVTFTQMKDSSTAYYDFSSMLAVNTRGANITINGGYINGVDANSGNGYGFQHTTGTITYKGVTINNSWTNENYATVVYEDCVFTGTYYVWTYAVPAITFRNCVFDKADSRAILVYSHGNNPIEATIENCKFFADAKGYTSVHAWTAAVEVDATKITDGATVKITNSTADVNYNGIVRVKAGANNVDVSVNGAPYVSTQAALEEAIENGDKTIALSAGEFTADFYNIDARDSLTIIGNGPDTKLSFSNLQVRACQFKELTISNCTIERMPNKNWGHLVFGSSNDAGGVYTISDCVFNGVGSQGIYINQDVAATFNIENCTFNGDFGGEGAITVQNNDGVDITVNVTDCEFNNIPATSHEIYVHYAYNGWTLNADGVTAYWKANP